MATSSAVSAKLMYNAAIFEDVSTGDRGYQAIQYLKDEGIVQGYSDGNFKPANSINRAEFLKIVMEASGKEAKGKDCYKDVKDAWYSGYVCAATKLGLVNGYKDGFFHDRASVDYQE